MKMGLAGVVENYEIRVNSKTKTPLEVNPKCFLLQYKGGLWLDFHKINK